MFARGRGVLGRIDARLRDAPGWKAIAYVVLKLPLACWGLYFTVVPWLAGLFYLTYPLWWLIFPLEGRGGRPRAPLPISTPFPAGGERITTFGGALLIGLLGIGALLIAPWTTRLPVIVDMWLMRGLLGGSGQSDRIRELESSRARLVDDSAALLRRVERNLHDGAQARLVALTMHLGRARDQLGDGGEPGDLDRARDLMAAAHQDAKAALTELRDLARGIHPPALDAGLEDALASLAATSATPAAVTAAIGVRPTPAIETIAYFCAAELLANVAKHSRASHAAVDVAGQDETLVVTVTDDGRRRGAAAPRRRAGRAGAAGRRGGRHAGHREPGGRPDGRDDHAPAAGLMRVVIAEDLAILREGLAGLLADRGHEVCAAVADGDGAHRGRRPAPAGRGDRGRADAAHLHRRGPARRDRAAGPPPRHRGAGVLAVRGDPVRGPAAGRRSGGVGYLLKDRVGDVAEFGPRWSGWRRAARRWTRRWSGCCCGPATRRPAAWRR